MTTLTQKGLRRAQRVRQFVVRQDPTSAFVESALRPREPLALYGDAPAGGMARLVAAAGAASAVGVLEGSGGPELCETDAYPECDLPTFLKHKSLRRRLDNAFANCYRSPMAEWFGDLFQGFFRK